MFVFVTHDPRIALASNERVVMHRGAMQDYIATSTEESRLAERLKALDTVLLDLRERIRSGERLDEAEPWLGLGTARKALA
jgi:hypothetical protein